MYFEGRGNVVVGEAPGAMGETCLVIADNRGSSLDYQPRSASTINAGNFAQGELKNIIDSHSKGNKSSFSFIICAVLPRRRLHSEGNVKPGPPPTPGLVAVVRYDSRLEWSPTGH